MTASKADTGIEKTALNFSSDGTFGTARGEFLIVDTLNRHPDWRSTASDWKNTNTPVYDHIPKEWVLVYEHYDNQDEEVQAIYSHKEFLISVRTDLRHNSVNLNAWGRDRKAVLEPIKHLMSRLESIKVDLKSDHVPVQFWYQGQQGPQSITRDIDAHPWSEVRENYGHQTVKKLDDLMGIAPPFEGGKLILMQGPPGTGKTHLIRTLIKEWAPWCDANYVGDTERFFARTGDLLSLVLAKSTRQFDMDDILADEEHQAVLRPRRTGADRYRLFIMEDTDEFLQNDAKKRTGQAMSRLLNLADGMIGQGLNALFLITTNEQIDNIHEAVRRPGRALANITFDKLPHDEAKTWLEKRGGDPSVITGEVSVAELYDKLREQAHIANEADKGDQGTGQYL